MISALSRAGVIFDNKEYLNAAVKSADFIIDKLIDNNGQLLKRYRNNNAGISGMIGGQAIDLHAVDHTLNLSEVTQLQQLKTGSLFGFSVEAGAILGHATAADRSALEEYAQALGLAFQITDDLLDVEGNQNETGKTVRKDSAAGKATFISLLGIAGARSEARALIKRAISCLEQFNDRAHFLRKVAQFVISRTH